jgi:hypothetical protein
MWLIDVSFIPMLDMSESDSNTVLWFEEITQRTSLVDRLQTHSVRVIEEMGARPPAIWTTFHLSTIFIQSRKRPLVAWSPATNSVAEPGQLIRVWDALCAPHLCLHASRAQSVASLCVTRTRDTQHRVAQPAITAPLSSRDATPVRPSVGAIAGFRFCLRTHTSD